MVFRKLRAKGYSSIFEYFKDRDKYSLNQYKRNKLSKTRLEIQKDTSLINQKIMNNNLSLENI